MGSALYHRGNIVQVYELSVRQRRSPVAHVVDTSIIDSQLANLNEMRHFGGPALTSGLSDDTIQDFLQNGYSQLSGAIEKAFASFLDYQKTHADYLTLSEVEQIDLAHGGLTNFYAQDTVNPYVAAAGSGPWIVSLKGAVIYDCGGYGMLGLGHAPQEILDVMNQPHVMANIMTASISQVKFIDRLNREIGHTRKDGTPYASFLCLNSGSEANSLASRLVDVNTRNLTDPGARFAGNNIRGLTLTGSFHGRTDRPARYSDSCAKTYQKHLASYRDDDYLITVEPNNIEQLESIFADAELNGEFIEAFFMEPVMGEGNPGMSINADFYARARELTRERGAIFIVDSIQAGLRVQGVLSIVDYPGFRELDAPDMESYSKALNAGQYPLSVLAISESIAALYSSGLYGNTMTTNPRALDIAVAVLDSLDETRRENISVRGKQLVDGLAALATETGGGVTSAQGTGLLASCALATRYKTYGANSIEDYLRRHGLGVIHGGERSLRYTPVFDASAKEIDLIVSLTKEALINGPTIT